MFMLKSILKLYVKKQIKSGHYAKQLYLWKGPYIIIIKRYYTLRLYS